MHEKYIFPNKRFSREEGHVLHALRSLGREKAADCPDRRPDRLRTRSAAGRASVSGTSGAAPMGIWNRKGSFTNVCRSLWTPLPDDPSRAGWSPRGLSPPALPELCGARGGPARRAPAPPCAGPVEHTAPPGQAGLCAHSAADASRNALLSPSRGKMLGSGRGGGSFEVLISAPKPEFWGWSPRRRGAAGTAVHFQEAPESLQVKSVFPWRVCPVVLRWQRDDGARAAIWTA